MIDIFMIIFLIVIISILLGMNLTRITNKSIEKYKNLRPSEAVIDNAVLNQQEEAPAQQRTAEEEQALEEDLAKFEKLSKTYVNPGEEVHSNRPTQIPEQTGYITSNDFGLQPSSYFVSCANSSINDKFVNNGIPIIANDIGCNKPNGLTAENYYKTFYRKQVVPIEDYKIKGYNYSDFNEFISPYRMSGLRILSNNTKGLPPDAMNNKHLPEGSNYAFPNTPSLPYAPTRAPVVGNP